MFQPLQTQVHVQLHKPTFCIIHSQNFTLFGILFYAFPLFQFKIYNYNCTIPILQLQSTVYNCTNCHLLHVKICHVHNMQKGAALTVSNKSYNQFLSALGARALKLDGPICHSSCQYTQSATRTDSVAAALNSQTIVSICLHYITSAVVGEREIGS